MRQFSVHDVEQRTPEWFTLRAGRVTGSVAYEAITPRKKGSDELAARRDLRFQIALERVTGVPQPRYVFENADTKRGKELEPAALAAYEQQTALVVKRIGFVSHDMLPIGYSPDGVIDDFMGLVEVKAPRPRMHLDYLEQPQIHEKHRLQALHGMFVTEASWCDFVSFCPDFPIPLLIRRYTPTTQERLVYEMALRIFLEECDKEEAALRERLVRVRGCEFTSDCHRRFI